MKINTLFQILIKPQDHSLEIKSIRAAIWSILDRGGNHVLRMVGSLIFTRILFPEAFGLMATANLALTMVNLFSDTGVKTAIVQKARGAEPEFLNTAWIISLCRAGLLSLIMIGLARPFSHYYHEPDLYGILCLMALTPLLSGLANPALALYIKNFRVEKLVVFEMTTQVLGMASTIILAMILRSVYALAIGMCLTLLFKTIGSYLISPYRPRFKWDKEAGTEIFHFGKYIFLNTMVSWIAINVDIFLIGKCLGMEMLGYYNLGKNFSYLVVTFCFQVVSQAYLPAVSSVSDDFNRIANIYKKTVAVFLAIAIPISMMLVLFSPDIIRFLYDPRYELAYISMFWLTLGSIFHMFGIINGTTFVAIGKPILETLSSTFGLVVAVAFMLTGIRLNGLSGAAVGMSLALVLPVVVRSFILSRKLKFPLRTVLSPWLQSTLTILIIIGLFSSLRPWLSIAHLYNVPFMVVIGLLGMAVSGGIYILLERPSLVTDRGKGILKFNYRSFL